MGRDSKSQSLESPQSTIKKSKKKRKREREIAEDDAAVKIPADHPATVDGPVEQQQLKVRIQVIRDQVDKTPPIVGYFPSGYNPLKSKVNSQPDREQQPLSTAPPQPSIRFYRHAQRVKNEDAQGVKNEKKGSERLELVVRPNDPSSTVEFVGKSYTGEAAAPQLCSYALGVLDKETKTLKIMPIAGNKILRLETKVQRPGSGTENTESTEEVDEEPIVLQRYGTKKSRRQDEKIRALKQGDNPDAQKDLGIQIENAQVNKDALEMMSAQTSRNIPPHNTYAETPVEAYPLNLIIHAEELGFLQNFNKFLRGGEVDVSSGYPSFVSNRIHKLGKIQDESEKKKLSSIFSFITHLVKFKDLHSRDCDPSTKKHTFPVIIRERLWNMFTPERRRLAPDKENLLISYVLVLTLHADDFQTDPEDIARDLRMSKRALQPHFDNLGCKFKASVVTLPTPLSFPPAIMKRRRRG
ncbi:hypothetical protein Tsubulata_018466 [Turnera subulata]|uniref:DNA-directed RNA polymerase I subunit rpa49 n=1 Tax=Turnera subulata TaxID=218843 RepID=A0A9Q0FS73_9ROSI|nr:hypothetical protein Tsubulata_018466 [Turnera subulata]